MGLLFTMHTMSRWRLQHHAHRSSSGFRYVVRPFIASQPHTKTCAEQSWWHRGRRPLFDAACDQSMSWLLFDHFAFPHAQGGPGCASTFGGFYEIGPWLVTEDLQLVENPGRCCGGGASTFSQPLVFQLACNTELCHTSTSPHDTASSNADLLPTQPRFALEGNPAT